MRRLHCLREKGVTCDGLLSDLHRCSGGLQSPMVCILASHWRHPYAGRDWQSGMYIRSGTISAKHFYDLQKAGNYASASQITPIQYFQSFEPALSAGNNFCICVFLRHVRNFSVSSSVCGGITRGRLFAKGRPLVYIVKEHGSFFHPSTV